MNAKTSRENRLRTESSAYLRAHASNPVDWYPWGPEALARARRENKPILLSIGYSACHWCHVMEAESFENPAIAERMNRSFVNIKVDRELRPDLDRLYQTAHQLITQRSGGWPLTIFLTPGDHKPFFAGTYFPPEPRHSMPGFGELLDKVAAYYRDNEAQVREQADALTEIYSELEPATGERELSREPVVAARQHLADLFDTEHGGFGRAPKFPSTPSLKRLLEHWRGTAPGADPDIDALYMAAATLARMAAGGLTDHAGGGFFRYSVDRAWQIPHFEKMLSDNGELLGLYSDMAVAGDDAEMQRVARRCADWMLRDMALPGGGFAASLDADVDGAEGAFYVWEGDEIRRILPEDDYLVFASVYGLAGTPNFATHWHLAAHETLEESAAALDTNAAAVRRSVDRSLAALAAARAERQGPARDDKLLTAWNALAANGLARAGLAFGEPRYSDAARHTIETLRTRLVEGDRLHAALTDDRPEFPAYLDDYAFTLDAALTVLQLGWDRATFEFAEWLAAELLQRFADTERGGFFFTAADHEALIHRGRNFADDALPSGNGVAARALTRYGFLVGDEACLAAARATFAAAWSPMTEYPHGHVTLIGALDEYLAGSEIVVLRGAADDLDDWVRVAATLYAPQRLVLPVAATTANLPEWLAAKPARPGKVSAYVCRGRTCLAPITTLAAFAACIGGAAG